MPVRPARDRSHVSDLQQIKNVGPSIAADFHRIGIRTPSDLCQADPYELYERLCQVDGQRHDPCVLDVFISAVEYMQGRPARPWWKYTARRKRELAHRQKDLPERKHDVLGSHCVSRLTKDEFLENHFER